jgi:hypothetical protein
VFERVHIDLGRFKDPPEKEASLMRFANGGVKDAQWLCDKNARRWYKPRTDGTSRFVFPTRRGVILSTFLLYLRFKAETQKWPLMGRTKPNTFSRKARFKPPSPGRLLLEPKLYLIHRWALHTSLFLVTEFAPPETDRSR